MRRVVLGLVLVMAGCAGRAPDARALFKSSTRLAKEVDGDDTEAVRATLMPATRARTDEEALLSKAGRELWSAALAEPTSVRPEGWMALGPGRYVEIVWTDAGWRFASDPYNAFGQSTPREALSSLVRASREGRWGVLVDLAPRRYRIGLSVEQVEAAWTEGSYADALIESRERLAGHLSDPIVADTHQARLELPDGHAARLEREGERWVVVDF